MFTGIITGLGIVRAITPIGGGKDMRLEIATPWADHATIATPGTKIVNGVTVGSPTILQNQNLAGYDVPQGVPFSASLGFVYKIDTSAGQFSLSGNDHYNSPYTLVLDSSVRQNRHHVLDASLNWLSPAKRYEVNLFVRNLTKQYVYAVGQVSTNFTIVPGAPRTFGGTLGVHF